MFVHNSINAAGVLGGEGMGQIEKAWVGGRDGCGEGLGVV